MALTEHQREGAIYPDADVVVGPHKCGEAECAKEAAGRVKEDSAQTTT